MLVLAWKLDAQSMGYFTLQEWLRGMGSLQYVRDLFLEGRGVSGVFSGLVLHLSHALARCDSTERLRNSLDFLRSVLNDSTSFKLIYRYAFDFARVSLPKSEIGVRAELSYRRYAIEIGAVHQLVAFWCCVEMG